MCAAVNEEDETSGSLRGTVRVARGLDVVVISDSEVLIQHGTRSRPAELLRDTDLTGVLGRVMRTLRTSEIRLADLLGQFDGEDRAEAKELLRELTAKGIITDASQSPVDQYLGFAMEARRSLESVRVAVIGAGPLGARICGTLVRHGIGHLDILDERHTDETWCAFADSRGDSPVPGQPANEAVRDLVAGPSTSVTARDGGFTAKTIVDAVERADLSVLALEQPQPRVAHLVNRACLGGERPWLLAQIDGSSGMAGPLFDPPNTACYNDYEVLARAVSTNVSMDDLYHRYLLGRSVGGFFPGLPSYVDVVAGYATLAAVEFLVSGGSWAMERVVFIDFDTMVIDAQDLLRLPRCPVCGGGRDPLHPPFPTLPPLGGVV